MMFSVVRGMPRRRAAAAGSSRGDFGGDRRGDLVCELLAIALRDLPARFFFGLRLGGRRSDWRRLSNHFLRHARSATRRGTRWRPRT